MRTCFLDNCLIAVTLHGRRDKGSLLGLLKPSCLSHLPKALLPNAVTWGLGFQHMSWSGGTQMDQLLKLLSSYVSLSLSSLYLQPSNPLPLPPGLAPCSWSPSLSVVYVPVTVPGNGCEATTEARLCYSHFSGEDKPSHKRSPRQCK